MMDRVTDDRRHPGAGGRPPERRPVIRPLTRTAAAIGASDVGASGQINPLALAAASSLANSWAVVAKPCLPLASLNT